MFWWCWTRPREIDRFLRVSGKAVSASQKKFFLFGAWANWFASRKKKKMKKMLKNIEILHPSLIGGDLNAPQRGAKNCRFFEKKPTIVPCHTAQNDILSVGPSVSFSTISTQDVALFCGAATKSGKNRLSPSVGNLDHEN